VYGKLKIAEKICDMSKDRQLTEIKVESFPCTVMIGDTCEVSFTLMPHRPDQSVDTAQNEYTKYFDYDKIRTCLLWRGRREGDYLTVDDKMHRQSLKNYMVNNKIPRKERDALYVLADEDHIVWIPGYRISTYYKITAHTENILKVQLRNGEEDV
jgi:tRNA(Ile)-lysidine synthase